jgi:hypothetical protein
MIKKTSTVTKSFTALSIYGNEAVYEKVNQWDDLLKSILNSNHLEEHKAKILDVFFDGKIKKALSELESICYKGSSSHFYETTTFSFESAEPLMGLQEKVLRTLELIDKNVVVQIDYSADTTNLYFTEGYRYILMDKDGEIYDNTQGSVLVQDLSASDEWETDLFDFDSAWNPISAHARLHPKNKATFLNETMDELEYVTDLGNDFKGSKKYLKNSIKRLKNAIKNKAFIKFE